MPKRKKIKSNGLELAFEEILKEMGVSYQSQFKYKNKIYDFLLIEYGILCETDGSYFHCDPRIYSKPINEMQRKNIKNDKMKDRLIKKSGLYTLVRFWESDIIKNKKKVVIELKQAISDKFV